MKYCVNCGMLLEDTQETCISCGMDVTAPGSTSLYPPEVQKKIDTQKKENQTKTRMVVMILVVLILLLAMIGVFAYIMGNRKLPEPTPNEPPVTEAEPEEEVVEEVVSEPVVEEPVIDDSDRDVSDKSGRYYNIASVNDSAGNVLFTTIYPEDFDQIVTDVVYDKCSEKFPINFSFVAGNEENTARVFYMSPQQFWYKVSDTGKTRSNERDLTHFMSYYEYSTPQAYIEALIRSRYEKPKSITLIEKDNLDSKIAEDFATLANSFSQSLLTGIGDYAHIGSDTMYAKMASENSSNVFKYEVVTKSGETIFCDYYVPVMANSFAYSSEEVNDRGTVTEWLVPCVVGFEAGNEDFYDEYFPDFRVFLKNSRPTKLFYHDCMKYSEKIEEAIKANEEPAPLDDIMLAEFAATVSKDEELSDLSQAMLSLNINPGSDGVEYLAEGVDISLCATAETMGAFVDCENGKVFISTSEEDYPGEKYTRLLAGDDNDSEE